MAERLELERVATGVEKEHRGLLARLSGEASARLDHEWNAGGAHTPGQSLELVPRENRPEVRHGHGDAVDLALVLRRRHAARRVRRDLIAEEVEIDPHVGRAAFAAAQDLSIEAARRRQIPDKERKVERLGHKGFS